MWLCVLLRTFDLPSIYSLSNQAGNREGWCVTWACFFFFLSFSLPLLVRNRGGSLTCQQRGVLFCKLCTHFFLPAITLFTLATTHEAHRSFRNFSVTFSEIIMKKKNFHKLLDPLPTKKKRKKMWCNPWSICTGPVKHSLSSKCVWMWARWQLRPSPVPHSAI